MESDARVSLEKGASTSAPPPTQMFSKVAVDFAHLEGNF